jgi:cardiolipin synthase
VSSRWVEGNAVELLENGEQFFPAVFESIRGARDEVILETFILFEDKVGWQLHEELVNAARRGARVDVMVDGFGSPDLGDKFIGELVAAGVHLRTFEPSLRFLRIRFGVLRRMHRKLVIVDGTTAFVGGINFSADQLLDFGPEAKQDYAVRVQGPIVDDMRLFACNAIARSEGHRPGERRSKTEKRGTAAALFITRDNVEHHNDIERHYRAAIRSARKSVLIANAYFFPGYLLLRELRRAARRGVEVRLVLQGEPDMPIAKIAASLLYEHLQRDGVEIHEYCKRPLHGKVAVVDDEWSTVGSSNLDPLSLSLNLEANLVIRDRDFAGQLRSRLSMLIERDCKLIEQPSGSGGFALWQSLRSAVVFHVLRRFPRWASLLPVHTPKLVSAESARANDTTERSHAG